ncbi:SRPBCC domain-containing protein [Demequina sp. TTPB684]|uniref:SRPBCC family protein n=1 Tax=unclassified Demequina TaxID=2620311 RepID=UPI001CF172B7|nr:MULTISPECIES: SRPBCC domain-containing protein [unclassified Demequina]MCB2411391.1 SRPBCC domain-containing protein [Demequina sp. TTPB684]UPU87766.1 SRPBCC domain-containing protein [Demequina sp. TMPB413]
MRREFALPEERPQIVMTEEVSAPIDKAWTVRFEPLYLAQWWRPNGYVNPIVEVDLVPGGRWRISQRDPEGNEFSFYGAFTAVDEPRVAVQSFRTELFPTLESTMTTEFTSHPRGTTIVTTHELPDANWLRGYLRLGALERMAESSEHYGHLLAHLRPRPSAS